MTSTAETRNDTLLLHAGNAARPIYSKSAAGVASGRSDSLLSEDKNSIELRSGLSPKVTSKCSYIARAAIAAAIGIAGCISLSNSAAAEWRWSATFEKTKGNNVLLMSRKWVDFHKGWLKNQKNGFRLHDFEVQSGTVRYSGVFKKSKSKDPSQIRTSLKVVMKGWKDFGKKGYRLQDFETWTENKKRYFGATYLKGKGAHALWVTPGWTKFHAEWVKYEKSGLRMHDFETWKEGNTQWYAGVFRAGKYPAGSSMGGTWDQFKKARDNFRKKGYRLVDLEVLGSQKGQKYYGLFGKTGPAQKLRVVNTRDDLLKNRKGFKKSGYKIDDIEATWFPAPPKPVPGTTKPLSVQFKPNTVLNKRSGMMFPKDMPSIRWPKSYKHCSSHEKQWIDRTWAMGHYMMWRADQVMDWLERNKKRRKAAWSHGHKGRNESGNFVNYSPRAWFGPYDDKRFSIASKAVEKVWSKRFRGQTFKVKCRVRGGKIGAHPCFQNNPGGNGKPGANHIVKGTINFCDKFFAPRPSGNIDKDMHRILGGGKTVVHEIFHHLSLANGLFVQDTHTHCDGKCRTQKMYGPEKASHLSHPTKRKTGHYKRALRNNDNYALFAYWVGRLAYGKKIPSGFSHLKQFPASGFKWK